MKPRYSFRVHINHYTTYADFNSVYVSDIKILSKPNKWLGMDVSKYVKRIQGKIYQSAGSHRYPIILPTERGMTLLIKGFPIYPSLPEHPCVDNGIISITDIKKCCL